MYTLETGSGDIDVAVTNGMSDQRMADPGEPHEWMRRELIQYLPKCTEAHARRLHDMSQNTAGVVAVELLAAAQGVDFRAPLKTSAELAKAHQRLRAEVPFYEQDRYFAPDIAAATRLVNGGLNDLVPASLLPSFVG